MNDKHLELCSSAEWAEAVERWIIPWVLDGIELGDDVVEVGPGPGLTTDVLRGRIEKLTAVEVDPVLAQRLESRLEGTNVDVVCADATAVALDPDRFSAATCFSMLHHMPSAEHQDRLFEVVHRVLRPGGIFLGVDSLDLDFIRDGHVDDTFVPIDLETFGDRLQQAGLDLTTIDIGDYQFRFVATKR